MVAETSERFLWKECTKTVLRAALIGVVIYIALGALFSPFSGLSGFGLFLAVFLFRVLPGLVSGAFFGFAQYCGRVTKIAVGTQNIFASRTALKWWFVSVVPGMLLFGVGFAVMATKPQHALGLFFLGLFLGFVLMYTGFLSPRK